MKTTLKDLKQYKGVKKEYKFITSVASLIEKKYSDIIEQFDLDLWEEALEEAFKEYTIAAFYKDSQTLLFTETDKISVYLNNKDTKKKTFSKNNLYIRSSRVVRTPSNVRNVGYCGTSYEINIDDIYVITDTTAFEEFTFESIKKEEKDRIERIKKEITKKTEKTEKEIKYRKLYGEKYDKKDNSQTVISLLEALDTKDTKKQFETISDILEEIADTTNEW